MSLARIRRRSVVRCRVAALHPGGVQGPAEASWARTSRWWINCCRRMCGMQKCDSAPDSGVGLRRQDQHSLNNTFGIDWYAAYLLRGTLHLNERISIYALLGGASLATFQQLRGWFKEKQTNTVFSGGAGLAYDYSDTLHLSVEGLFLGNNAAPQMPSFQGLDARAVTFNVLLTN